MLGSFQTVLNFIHKLGKTDLTQFLDEETAMRLIDETEKIYTRFGMDGQVYPTNLEEAQRIRKEARNTVLIYSLSGKNIWAVIIYQGILRPWQIM